MASTTTGDAGRPLWSLHWAFFALAVVNIVVGKWWPDSLAATLTSYAFIGSITIWFGLRIRAGYRRRRPYWTRESWFRFARLAWMPVAATIFVLAMSTEPGLRLMRSTPSATRTASAIVFVTMLIFGSIGLMLAVDWLFQGAPSEQFTRRSWVPRRRSNSTPRWPDGPMTR